MAPSQEPVRVDKWLWAARLAKTRALAAEAVNGGRVHVNGRTVKASKEVGPGDQLELTTGPVRIDVRILGTAPRRVSAALAAELYEESADSRAERERLAAERRLLGPTAAPPGGARPTKRDRRRYDALGGAPRRDRG
jgi:ribosome-associated heat shock protein Hsp15